MKRSVRFAWMMSRHHILGLCAIMGALMAIDILLPTSLMSNELLQRFIVYLSPIYLFCCSRHYNIQLSLSMGATRNDYFLGLQCATLMQSVVATLLLKGLMMLSESDVFYMPLWLILIGYCMAHLLVAVIDMVLVNQDTFITVILIICFGFTRWVYTSLIETLITESWSLNTAMFAAILLGVFVAFQIYLWESIHDYMVK